MNNRSKESLFYYYSSNVISRQNIWWLKFPRKKKFKLKKWTVCWINLWKKWRTQLELKEYKCHCFSRIVVGYGWVGRGDQWRIQDFPRGGRQLPKWVYEPIFLAENCLKKKEFWNRGGASLAPPRSATVKVLNFFLWFWEEFSQLGVRLIHLLSFIKYLSHK